jgi:hypothetical protein
MLDTSTVRCSSGGYMEQQYFLDKYDYFQVKELTGQYKANFPQKNCSAGELKGR